MHPIQMMVHNLISMVSVTVLQNQLQYNEKELKDLLLTADDDNSGFIFEEFRKLFDQANLKKVFNTIDDDSSGSITETELLNALVSMHIHVTKKDKKNDS